MVLAELLDKYGKRLHYINYLSYSLLFFSHVNCISLYVFWQYLSLLFGAKQGSEKDLFLKRENFYCFIYHVLYLLQIFKIWGYFLKWKSSYAHIFFYEDLSFICLRDIRNLPFILKLSDECSSLRDVVHLFSEMCITFW